MCANNKTRVLISKSGSNKEGTGKQSTGPGGWAAASAASFPGHNIWQTLPGGEACRSRRDNRDQVPEFRGTAGKALADLPKEQTPVRVLVWTVWEAPHFV